MRKWIAAALAGVLLLASGCSPKEITLNAPAQAETQTLRVQATAETRSVPDIVYISIGVIVSAEIPAEVRTKSAERINSIIAALTEIGIAKEDIRTEDFSMFQNDSYDNYGNRIAANYRMNQSLRITVRDLTLAGEVIDRSIEAGGNNLGGVSYALSDETALYEKVLEQAIASARAKADIMAAAAGKTVVDVRCVTEDLEDYPFRYEMMNADTGGGDSDTQLMAGNVTVSANVTVEYVIQ